MLKNYSDAKITGPNSKSAARGYRVTKNDAKTKGEIVVTVFVGGAEVADVLYSLKAEGPYAVSVTPKSYTIKVTPLDLDETFMVAKKAAFALFNPKSK